MDEIGRANPAAPGKSVVVVDPNRENDRRTMRLSFLAGA